MSLKIYHLGNFSKVAYNVEVFMKLWQLESMQFQLTTEANSDLKLNAHSSSHNFINTLLY